MTRNISDSLRFKHINGFLLGKEILDLGSSEGYLHELLVIKNPSKRIYTLDIEGKPDFHIDLNNPENLDKQFDSIIAGEILEHVENPTKLIRFCHNHLKSKGILVITTPNAIGLQYIKNPSWCSDSHHIHAFTMPMLELLLKNCGFEVIVKKYINAFWNNKNPLQLIPLIFPRLKTDLMIVGVKK